MRSFKSNTSSTLTMAANGVSQNMVLPSGGGLFVSVVNGGANIAFCEFTSDSNQVVAAPASNVAGGFPVFANQPPLIMQLRETDTRVVAISAGTSTLYFTRGEVT